MDLPDLCTITGLNGAGKTKMLSKIATGQIRLQQDGEFVPIVRILQFDMDSFSNYQYSPQNNQQNYDHYGDPSHRFLRQFQMGLEYSPEIIYDFFRNQLGFLNKDFDEQLKKAIEDGDLGVIGQYIRTPNFNKYTDSIAAALKKFYDLQVANYFIEKSQQASDAMVELHEPFDVESVLNAVLRRLGLKYEVSGGEEYKASLVREKYSAVINTIIQNEQVYHSGNQSSFEIALKNLTNEKTISIADLSSGEKALLSIASVIAIELRGAESDVRPSVLLFDEPDAHLHPDYSSVLIDIFMDEFIRKYGFKIIMTTHSPITVALAESEMSILMESGQVYSVSRQKAIAGLMTGVPHLDILNKNNIYVFVEGPRDSEVFSGVFSIMRKLYLYQKEPLFLPSSHAGGGGNRELVEHLVMGLNNNPIIRGIIDWDRRNESRGNVYCHSHQSRYAVDNLIFDPLIMMCFIFNRYGSTNVTDHLPKDASIIEIIADIDSINERVLKFIDGIMGYLYSDLIECGYICGISLMLPKSYLHVRGHDLEKAIRLKIVELKRISGDMIPDIIRFLKEYPQIIPIEFKDCFDEVLKN